MTQDTTFDPAARKAELNGRRKRLFTYLGAAILVAAVLWFFYWLLIGSRQVTTEDAYVGADTAQVTALVAGPVIATPVAETQFVRKGTVVAVIDPAEFRLAVERARAEVGRAERRVQGYYANEDVAAAQTQARTSDLARAQAQLVSARSDLARAEAEHGRRQRLAGSGAVSGDELNEVQNRRQTAQAAVTAAEAAVQQARANVTAAQAQRQAAAVLVEGVDLQSNPEIAAARAQLHQAQLELERTIIRAPVDGIVTKKAIQVGQRVPTGALLMNVVPVQSAFVDANFKEVQLRKVRIGSPAVLTSDLYGDSVKFHGKVVGVSGGSGSAFSLIPAQNATGNWIKVVQRVPVRIALDPKELAKHPLRVGLSMEAEVEVQ